jgi:hypothetical protein
MAGKPTPGNSGRPWRRHHFQIKNRKLMLPGKSDFTAREDRRGISFEGFEAGQAYLEGALEEDKLPVPEERFESMLLAV